MRKFFTHNIIQLALFIAVFLSLGSAMFSAPNTDNIQNLLQPFQKSKESSDAVPMTWDGSLGKRTISAERPAENQLKEVQAKIFLLSTQSPRQSPPSSIGAIGDEYEISYKISPKINLGGHGSSTFARAPSKPMSGLMDEQMLKMLSEQRKGQLIPGEETITVPETIETRSVPPVHVQETIESPSVKTMPTAPSINTITTQEPAPSPVEEIEVQPNLPPPVSQEPTVVSPSKDVLINFNNVSIIEYLNFISKLANKNFIFDDPDLDFRVTIISNEPVSIDDIMTALLQELRVHGLSLIEVGNSLIIHRNPKANSPSTVVTKENPKPPYADVITQVFRLENASPEKMVAVIKPLLSDLALVETSLDTNQLIVTDLAGNIKQVGLLLQSLDAPSLTLEVGQYAVKNASVASAASLAEKILLPIAQGKPIEFIPHHATNSIFIVSTPFLVDRAIAVLQQIDVPNGSTRILSIETLQSANFGEVTEELEEYQWESSQPLGYAESTKFFIKKLEYARGDEIEIALKRIGDSLQFSGGNSYGPVGTQGEVFLQHTDLITTIESIQWIEYSNSLVYTGTAETIAKVTEIIEEIDLPMRQVLIEMLILDTTLNDSLNYGVDWGSAFGGPFSAGIQGFFSNGSSLPAALNSASPKVNPANTTFTVPNLGITSPVTAGFTQGVVGRNITHCGLTFNSIGALVQAVHTDTRIDILLNPKILVEDNVPAEVFVGENVPYLVQSIVNNEGTVLSDNYEFRDVGTTLKVTPLIGYNDIVTLDILQEVTRIVPGVIVGPSPTLVAASTVSGAPTTQKSRTVTRLHVPDGYFVIMSGIIEDQDTKTRSQVPCLGGLPLLGAAFSNQGHSDEKRNLMIFIHAQIIENDEIDTTTKRYQDIFREKCRQPKRLWHEVDGALEFFNLKGICSPIERSRTD